VRRPSPRSCGWICCPTTTAPSRTGSSGSAGLPAAASTATHSLRGFPEVVQEDPRENGQVALFRIGDDAGLGFSFLDAGDLLFFGAPEDIRAQRWDQLTIWPSSG
jgi:Domain of unknown function (DUF1963)